MIHSNKRLHPFYASNDLEQGSIFIHVLLRKEFFVARKTIVSYETNLIESHKRELVYAKCLGNLL